MATTLPKSTAISSSTARRALLLSVLAIATCGLIYELLAGTIASYLLGDSVTQFSTIIGVYLFAMGVGSYLSRFVETRLLERFIEVEILVGLVGGTSSLGLFVAFAETGDAFRLVLYGWVLATGTLVGLEIPLLMRILEKELELRELVAQVLTLDYVGALVASVLFPLWLVPKLGLLRSAFAFGVLNVVVAIWAISLFRGQLDNRRRLLLEAWGTLALLLAGFFASDQLLAFSEQRLYKEKVVYARSSPYQRIVMTRSDGGAVRLYLNGDLQLSTLDEYRYHEALVHPALLASNDPRRVLVLGGGDGMAVREVLRDPRVEQVRVVDLDPLVTELFRHHESFSALNDDALSSDKVVVDNADAFVWLEDNPGAVFDLVILDFPDPSSFSLGKLYTPTFYRRLEPHLAPGAVVATQATSPLWTRRAFWCIAATLESVGFGTRPYHAPVPTFGEWGFILASRSPLDTHGLEDAASTSPVFAGLRYLDAPTLAAMFDFPRDLAEVDVEVNRLNNQILVRYHEEGLRRAGV